MEYIDEHFRNVNVIFFLMFRLFMNIKSYASENLKSLSSPPDNL